MAAVKDRSRHEGPLRPHPPCQRRLAAAGWRARGISIVPGGIRSPASTSMIRTSRHARMTAGSPIVSRSRPRPVRGRARRSWQAARRARFRCASRRRGHLASLKYTSADELRAAGAIDGKGRPIIDPAGNLKTAEQGAATSVWCATSHQLDGRGGVDYEDCDIALAVSAHSSEPHGVRPWAIDPRFADRLWRLSERLTGKRNSELTLVPLLTVGASLSYSKSRHPRVLLELRTWRGGC